MYSLGMRGSWCEKTFCSPTSHIRIFLLDFCESELPITWNSMMPRRSSSRAVSSRAALADSRLVSGPSMAAGSVMVSMTSFTSSMGMSPMTRIRLASSSVKLSGSFRFSPGRGSGVLASRLAAELLLLSFLLKRGVVGTATVLTAAGRDTSWAPSAAGTVKSASQIGEFSP